MKQVINFLRNIWALLIFILFCILGIFNKPIEKIKEKQKKEQEEKLRYIEFYDVAKVVRKRYIPAYTKYNFLFDKQFYEAEYYVIFNYNGWKCTVKGKKAFESLIEQSKVLVHGYQIYNEKGEMFQVHINEVICRMS